FTTMEEVNVTDVYLVKYDVTDDLIVEINNGAELDYHVKLEKDGKIYLSTNKRFNQTLKRPLVHGDYTLKVEIPILRKELRLPVHIQKNKDKFYSEAGDWRVSFDKRGKNTEVISWLFNDVKEDMDHYE